MSGVWPPSFVCNIAVFKTSVSFIDTPYVRTWQGYKLAVAHGVR